MPEYRYYCLNNDGKITRGKHIEVPNLAAAICAAMTIAGPPAWEHTGVLKSGKLLVVSTAAVKSPAISSVHPQPTY